MSGQVKPIPEGFHTLAPHVIVRDGNQAIAFYKKAFGAEVRMCVPGPGGQGIMHAEIQIGDSVFMLCDEFPKMGVHSPQKFGGSPVTLHLYVEDADKVFDQAVAAGATAKMPLQDMFWGDRYGKVTDPFGHEWSIATHKQDLTPEEIARASEAAFSEMPHGCS